MVRMLNSPRPEVPSHLDELAAFFGSMPDPEFATRRTPEDTEYTLLTALIETGEWLEEPYNKKQADGDKHSMSADLRSALDLRGPRVTARTPEGAIFPGLMQEALERGDDLPTRVTASQSLTQLQKELAEPVTAVAAFDDLLEVLRDPDNSPGAVDRSVSVLIDVLVLAGRPARDICKLIGAVVDDQAIEIGEVRRQLDGTSPDDYDRPDAQLGLDEDDRLELARRYLREPQPPQHHVVWVGYANARVQGDQDWREVVGRVEFFDGPTLVAALADPRSAPISRELPAELLELQEKGWLDSWPQPNEPASWVVARVDLGVGYIVSPIRTARAEADDIVALAKFQWGSSTWKPLAGVMHFADGARVRWEDFHIDDLDDVLAAGDRTADEFPEIASMLGLHLPVRDPTLRRLLRELSTLNVSTGSLEIDLLTHDVRVVEMVARRCQQDWPGFPNAEATSYTRRTLGPRFSNAVEAALFAFRFENGKDLAASVREYLPNGRVRIDHVAALKLVPQLAVELPLHTAHGRRLRELARRTADVQVLNQWLREIEADYRTKIARATRFRNGITHGAAASLEVARTVRSLINSQARNALARALYAISNGEDIGDAVAERRRLNRAWRTRTKTSTSSVSDTIFALDTPAQPDGGR